MSLWGSFEGFIRAFRSGEGWQPRLRPCGSLAETIKQSTHVRGGFGCWQRGNTEQQHEIVSRGHENYAESFEKDD